MKSWISSRIKIANLETTSRIRRIAAVAALVSFTSLASAQQASITLQNYDAKYCYSHNNEWSLAKLADKESLKNSGTVTWTIMALKDSSKAPTFTVHGGLTIYNSGSAPATIGNIVLNLQRPAAKNKQNVPWVSIAADMANATYGDLATTAKIAASASAEDATVNAAQGQKNYTVSGAQGTFIETSGSGKLDFTDASNNTAFSLVPQPTIPVGGSITLLYHATFQTSVLPPAGTLLRAEALVSFGNAGARGGSGATVKNIDINGNGVIDSDEANVRTVASRVTLAPLPAVPEECNDTVTVTDTGVTTTGTVITSNPAGFEAFPVTISDSTVFTVSADVDSGADGGSACNQADLNGEACGGKLNVIVGYDTTDPLNPVPVYATYVCNEAAHATASACVTIIADHETQGIKDGDFWTFSQGGLGGSGVPYDKLANNFASIYPHGVEVGIPGAGGYSMTFTSAAAVQAYLPAGRSANKLNADLINPTSSSSGVFGGQVVALKLNIALSDAGVTPPGFGGLYYCNAGDSLSGLTVREILAVAETALGGGALPIGYTYTTLSELCANLDLSFDEKTVAFPNGGGASAWAVMHLSITPCP